MAGVNFDGFNWIDAQGNVWMSGTSTNGNVVCVSERIPSSELELTDDDRLMLAGMKISPE